jgi:hypothetical protein
MNTRRVITWALLIAVGVYAIAIFALGRLAFAYGYHPEAHSVLMFISYLQPMLVLPCFLFGLLPRKWATAPLWIVCTSISIFPFIITDARQKFLLAYRDTPHGLREVKEIMLVMLIPLLVQIAVLLKTRSGKQEFNRGSVNTLVG